LPPVTAAQVLLSFINHYGIDAQAISHYLKKAGYPHVLVPLFPDEHHLPFIPFLTAFHQHAASRQASVRIFSRKTLLIHCRIRTKTSRNFCHQSLTPDVGSAKHWNFRAGPCKAT